MSSREMDLERYMKEAGSSLHRGAEDKSISDLNDSLPMSSLESYFIFDLVQNKVVREKGIARLLGSEKKDINLSDILEHIHEEDSVDVGIILKQVFAQLIHAKIPVGSSYLKMSFHIHSRKGEKLGIISDNIVYSNDLEGRPISVLVKYLEADFMKSAMTVGWWVDSGLLDPGPIERALDRGASDLFTPRELEILQLILSDSSSAQIAEALCLSEHTIVTHRKNIFAKSGCHSLEELKEFCIRERIF